MLLSSLAQGVRGAAADARRRSPSGVGRVLATAVAGVTALAAAVPAGAQAARSAPSPASQPSAAASAVEPVAPAPGTGLVSLTDPARRSRWAFLHRAVVARSEPSRSGRAVAKLDLKTEDRTDELVLAEAATADGRWVRVRLPVRPIGRTGWVPRAALGPLRSVSTWLVIDRRRLRATLFDRGRAVFRAPIGIGEARWPTPRGEFYVRNRLEGYGGGSPYGPIAFGTSAMSPTLTDWPGGGVIGIHGTNQPGLLPGRVSHGCVRLRNRDILRLARLMPVGTPVTVR